MGMNFSGFDLQDLKKAEEAYRFVLRQEPDNMDLRVHLAWSLLFQALYFSGQEATAAHDRIPETNFSSAIEANKRFPSDSRRLLQECLRQTTMVKQLSTRVSNQMDAEKIEALVLMAGNKELLNESEARGARIQNEILHAICHND